MPRLAFPGRFFAIAVCAGALFVGAAPATASVTLGKTATVTPLNDCSNLKDDWVQPSVASGNSYTVPAVGTITSWSTRASATSGQVWTMKVFRQVSGSTYRVVAHDGPRALTGGALNKYATNIPVQPGDLVGMNDNDTSTPVSTACTISSPGSTLFFGSGSLADGESGVIASPVHDARLNLEAVFNPSNSFTIRAVTRHKKRGTATLSVDVPNPGVLTVAGTGVKAASAHAASKSVTPGTAELQIKAKGKKRRKLNRTGRVKLNLAISYRPTDGDTRTQSLKLKLIKR